MVSEKDRSLLIIMLRLQDCPLEEQERVLAGVQMDGGDDPMPEPVCDKPPVVPLFEARIGDGVLCRVSGASPETPLRDANGAVSEHLSLELLLS